jgi:hypothetical protein
MKDKNGTTLKVGDRIKVVLDCGMGFPTSNHTGVVGDRKMPLFSRYECYFDEDNAVGGCFVYSNEIEKV